MSKIFFSSPLLLLAFIIGTVLVAVAQTFVSANSYPYNPQLAMEALEYCKISYCTGSAIQSWNCPACPLHPNFRLYNVYQNASVNSQAFTGYNPSTNRIVVTFRGTHNVQNWIQDLTFTKVPCAYCGSACSNCQVHKGFQEEYYSYRAPILNDLSTLISKYPSASIGVFGHSLGAAVAVHCAAELNLRYGASKNIVEMDFGRPRDGDAAFSDFASRFNLTRVVHKADIVPHVPTMSMGFVHATHEIWYDNDGNTTWKNCNDGPGHEDPDCSDSTIPISVEDHLHYLGRSTECNLQDDVVTPKVKLSRETLHKLRHWAMQDSVIAKNQRK